MNISRVRHFVYANLLVLLMLGTSWGLATVRIAWAQTEQTALEPAGELAKRTPTATPTFISTAPPPEPTTTATDTPTLTPLPTAPATPLPIDTPPVAGSATPATAAPTATPTTHSPTATALATATATLPPTATPTPQPVIQTLTLAVLDGWDELFADRLSQLEQVSVVAASDDDSWEIAANAATSFEFESGLPADAKLQTVKLFIEHSEDNGLAADKLYWEVGQGELANPTVRQSQNPTVLSAATETAVEWDITEWVNTVAQLQALKLVIRNGDESASSWVDHLYLVVTYIGDEAVAPTPTPLPAAINLQGQIQLEGRPTPPHPQWALPLSINLRTTDAKGASNTRGFSLMTSNDGSFQMNDLQAGAYQLAVKGAHTLQRVVNVELQMGDNPIFFGLLREGDAVNDNRINILDFSRLASAFGRCSTMTNYLASADFDQDGCIAQPDIDLLVQNFGQSGDVLGAPQNVSASALAATPIGTITNKRTGDRFTVLLTLSNSGNQPIDAAALYLNFDPAQLEVTGLAGSAQLPLGLLDQVDNPKGELDYAVGRLGDGVSGSTALIAITFVARRNIQSTALSLETAGLRQSLFAYRGQALSTVAASGAGPTVAMQEVIFSQSVFLPVIQTTP